jgi:erythromycin esterase
MGRNLLWLADGYFPERKIIVWAASIHVARNLDSLEAVEAVEPDSVPRPEAMGDLVFDALGDQIYALGFTVSTGSTGSVFKPAYDLSEVSEGAFEDLMNRAGFEYAIVDFRHIPAGGDWLGDGMISRPFGYVEERGDWTKVLDGLMYIREMIPSQGSIE